MHCIQRLKRGHIQMHDARSIGQQVHAAGKGACHRQMRMICKHGLRDLCRGSVFIHIARRKLRNNDRLDPLCPKRVQMRGCQPQTFAQPARRQRDGVGQHCALGLRSLDGSEPHGFLKVWIICDRIDTAISGGPAAPISSPMGPLIRAISAAVKPASSRRDTRAAWVRFDPSAPI